MHTIPRQHLFVLNSETVGNLVHSFKMPFTDVDVEHVGLSGGDLLLQQWQHFPESQAFAESAFPP